MTINEYNSEYNFQLLPQLDNNLMAQTWHQSYRKLILVPIHIVSDKLGLTPVSSALANAKFQ